MDISLTNDGGLFCPGNSIGQAQITGNYLQNAGAIQIEIASLSDFDKMIIGNRAVLGGAMEVSFLNGYQPSYGDEFTVITAWRFDDLSMTIPDSFYERVDNGTELTLVYIPEPGSLALLFAGAAATLVRRHKRAALS